MWEPCTVHCILLRLAQCEYDITIKMFAFRNIISLKHYNLKVTDLGQPLIVSNPKRKDRNRGDDQPILLVPELCTMTGEQFISFRTCHICQTIC